jgi:hypothetical protein
MVRQKLRNLLKDIFVQGISPQKLALTISLGIFFGTVPVIWGSTVLCAAFAFKFRLNQPGIQAANFLAYPVQIALLVPFYRMGAIIFPWGPAISLDILLKGIRNNWIGNIAPIIFATLKAIAVWLLIAAPLALILYFLMLSIFARMRKFKELAHT